MCVSNIRICVLKPTVVSVTPKLCISLCHTHTSTQVTIVCFSLICVEGQMVWGFLDFASQAAVELQS